MTSPRPSPKERELDSALKIMSNLFKSSLRLEGVRMEGEGLAGVV